MATRFFIVFLTTFGIFIQGVPRCGIGMERALEFLRTSASSTDHHCDEAEKPDGEVLSTKGEGCPCQVNSFTPAFLVMTAKTVIEPSIILSEIDSPEYSLFIFSHQSEPPTPPPRLS